MYSSRSIFQFVNDLHSWLKSHGHEKLALLAEKYAVTSLRKTTLVLPGPTGERNTLAFASRGRIFCAANSFNVFLNQLAAVLATENIPVLSTNTLALIPPSLPDSIKRIILSAEGNSIDSQVALIESTLLASLRPVIAAQEDCIISVIETRDNELVPLWRLLAERAVSVNTTAAGGNASLMTLAD